MGSMPEYNHQPKVIINVKEATPPIRIIEGSDADKTTPRRALVIPQTSRLQRTRMGVAAGISAIGIVAGVTILTEPSREYPENKQQTIGLEQPKKDTKPAIHIATKNTQPPTAPSIAISEREKNTLPIPTASPSSTFSKIAPASPFQRKPISDDPYIDLDYPTEEPEPKPKSGNIIRDVPF